MFLMLSALCIEKMSFWNFFSCSSSNVTSLSDEPPIQITREVLKDNHSYHYTAIQNEKPITYQTGIENLENNVIFRSEFINTLKEVPFDAYVWEMPAITKSDQKAQFEFVITRSNGLLGKRPDDQTFESHFIETEKEKSVTHFFNLGGDAKLISPLPEKKWLRSTNDYSHLAAFMKNAPEKQVNEFWQTIGISMRDMLDRKPLQPLWLSTAGHGVAWLHARIDETPKYYSYKPYKNYINTDDKKLNGGRSKRQGESNPRDGSVTKHENDKRRNKKRSKMEEEQTYPPQLNWE